MRISRHLGTMGGKMYQHTKTLTIANSNSYYSYNSGSWGGPGYYYSLGTSKNSNQCMGYGYEFREDGSAYFYHPMAVLLPFKFSFTGKSVGLKIVEDRCYLSHQSRTYGWAISTTFKASDYKNAYSAGTTDSVISGTFTDGVSYGDATRSVNICNINTTKILPNTDYYLYLWPVQDALGNIHIMGNSVITLTYENNKKNG